jgi:Flp pilus assembly protein TadB
MKTEGDRHDEFERRERELRQREVELRIREMESQMQGAKDAPYYKTTKHQPENSQPSWMKKAILGAKLLAIAVAVIVAVRIAALVAGIVILAALTAISYKLFFDSKPNQP